VQLLSSLIGNKTMYSTPTILRLMGGELTLPPNLHAQDASSSSNAGPSLNGLSLVELLEMFHAHAATDRRYKIYALLGLSDDVLIPPAIRVDYTKCWSTLFREVVAHILGPLMEITTWDDREEAIITGSGCLLGLLKVEPDQCTLSCRSPTFYDIEYQTWKWIAQFPIPQYG
jgi:hypothetical protein